MSLNAFGCRRFVRELSGCTICVYVGAILIHVHVCTCTLYIHVATIMQKTKNVCNFTHSGTSEKECSVHCAQRCTTMMKGTVKCFSVLYATTNYMLVNL